MESLISTFHLDWKLMIAQVVNFAIVFTVLYIFALKPLKKLMDERGEKIKGGLENAEKQVELLKNAEAEYEAAMARANAESLAKSKELKKEMETLRASELEKLHAEFAALKATNTKQIEAEKAKAMDDIRKEAVTLVVSVAEKVLGSAMTDKIDAKLVEESMKNI